MKFYATTFMGCLALATSIALIGCAKPNEETGPKEVSENPPPAPPGGEHDHPSEGPHHGSLIELGQDEYHAELVRDEKSGTVTIYLLGSDAKTAVPIDASELTVNVSHDGQPEQFKLAAQSDAGDPEGQASRFVSTDKELSAHLHEEGADARLVVKIGDKSYNGKISHDHDHGHDHKH